MVDNNHDDRVKQEVMKDMDLIEVPSGLKEEIWKNVQPYNRPQKKRKTIMPLLAVVACLAIVIPLGISFYSHQHQAATSLKNNAIPKSTLKHVKTTQDQFDYKKYLSFTPMLPSYTGEHSLTHTKVLRELNFQGGNILTFTASYGEAFTVSEAPLNQEKHVFVSSFKDTSITIGDAIQATLQKQNDGATVAFTKNGIAIAVSYINNRLTTEELKKIAGSVSVQVAEKPTEIYVGEEGDQAARNLSFKPILPGDFDVPNGLTINSLRKSQIHTLNGKKNELYEYEYDSNHGWITLDQTTPSVMEASKDKAYHVEKINGVTVYLQQKIPQLPTAEFIEPNTKIQITIRSTVSETLLKQIIESLIKVKKK